MISPERQIQKAYRKRDLSQSPTPPRKKNTTLNIALICILIALMIFLAFALAYIIGKSRYKDKFLANTFINGIDVSGKNLSQSQEVLGMADNKQDLIIEKQDGEKIDIAFSDFDYSYDISDELKKIYDKQNHTLWFISLFEKSDYELKLDFSYNSEKLVSMLKSADWGDKKNQNAKIELTDNGYEITPEIQGDEMDFDILKDYVISCVDKDVFDINAKDSGCYKSPKTTSEDLKEDLERLKKYSLIEINYDFDYTTETLTGEELADLVAIKEDGKIKVDKDKCEKYIEKLAEKYDTYNTERKFKSTNRGEITIPTGSDARYGWWIDQQKMLDQLVEMLEKGESFDDVEPIYFQDGEFAYVGLKSARTEKDDIGKTYVEIDLTNQTLWYYEDGELKLESLIVSGQTTSQARTTEAGVYRVWFKATDYRMKASNSDGESWDSTCSYWTSVSPVGIGLHDTQHRTAFGGEIYKTNGSQGCINMPLDKAKYVYDNVDYDTPVVMYY